VVAEALTQNIPAFSEFMRVAAITSSELINWYRSKVFTFGCCGQNQTRNQIWEFRPRRTGIFSRAIV